MLTFMASVMVAVTVRYISDGGGGGGGGLVEK